MKVKEALSTVASPVSPEETPMTTLPTGFESKTTVKVSVEVPCSFTDVSPLDSVTVKPGASKQAIPSPSFIFVPVPPSTDVSPSDVTFTVPVRSDAEPVSTSHN